MKLLVVDDLEAVGVIVAEIASQSGWQSIHCTQADRIIETIQSEKIDVVLMDYFMPGKSGLDVAIMIRESGLKTTIIFFSGMASQIDRAKADELGVFKILDKPLSVKELRQTLSEARDVQSF
jgi:DNA-binding response OmpR family regulator